MDHQARRALLNSARFQRLVSRRWRVSLVLTALLFVLYYGYILLIALNRSLVTARLGGTVPLGIPLGAGVIAGAWLLTAAYVVWANREYDPEVERLRSGPVGAE
jgi:uncharacterized membrane protein (DUF485 family)